MLLALLAEPRRGAQPVAPHAHAGPATVCRIHRNRELRMSNPVTGPAYAHRRVWVPCPRAIRPALLVVLLLLAFAVPASALEVPRSTRVSLRFAGAGCGSVDRATVP